MRSASKVSSQAIVAAFSGTDLTVRTVVDEHIDRVLELVEGNLSAACILLGLNRRTLQRRARLERARPRRRARR